MGLDVYLHETIADDAVVECGTCQGKKTKARDYYLKALDIIIETCEWVLAQPGDISRYLLHWSG